MKAVLTDEALVDLERIGDYIAEDSPLRVRSIVADLIEAARRIGGAPRAFPLVPRYAHLDVRRKVRQSYLIFYRIEGDRISILHVLHGAQDYEALLFPDS